MGRLVLTHSTYIEGLIVLLKKISKHKGIYTITPGAISRSKGNSSKLTLKITRLVLGGHKLLARKGRSVQEIYILSDYNNDELSNIIKDCY